MELSSTPRLQVRAVESRSFNVQVMVLRTNGQHLKFIDTDTGTILTGWLAGGEIRCSDRTRQNPETFTGVEDSELAPSVALKIDEQKFQRLNELLTPLSGKGNGFILEIEVRNPRYWIVTPDNEEEASYHSIEFKDYTLTGARLTQLSEKAYARRNSPYGDEKPQRSFFSDLAQRFLGNGNQSAETGAVASTKQTAKARPQR